MASNHDYVALDWVRGEIDTTLAEAQSALEAYVNEPKDTARLRFCLNHIHQIRGTLQMVEFYGAAVLAEEMEKLTEAIMENRVASRDDALEVLMEGMLHLPNYLERLRQSRQDLPLLLMPSLNDLRAARGEALLTDNALFNPDLSPARKPVTGNTAQRMKDPKTIPQLRKVRQMYQFALAGLIRERDVANNLEYMHKSLLFLEGLSKGAPMEQLWRTATALVEGFEHHQLNLSLAVKSLLRDIDHIIKQIIEDPESLTRDPIPEATLKHLLYYTACTEAVTDRLRSVRADYKLDEALPDEQNIAEERARLSGPDSGALSSVAAALGEELNRVKDDLDLFMRNQTPDLEDLEALSGPLSQVANTMTVLGLGKPRHLLESLIADIGSAVERDEVPADDALLGMASTLLQVEDLMKGGDQKGRRQLLAEQSADSPVASEQLADAHTALIQEARNSIEQAKLAIVEFIGSQWDMRHIRPVPEQLKSIQGGLTLIPLNKAADLLGLCASFIQDQLIDAGVHPDWTQLDTLADAVTSIEYYLERMADGGDENPALLEVAEEALKHLATAVPAPAESSAAAKPVMAEDKEADVDLIDDEIREIFVEEAGEVISTMLSCYPRWHENPSDGDALTELRRAFHTLKGSGRLVGAGEIGELSWAVENLLNKVIEGAVEPGLAVFELVEDTIDRIPEMVASFSRGEKVSGTEGLITNAREIIDSRARDADAVDASELQIQEDASTADQTAEADADTSAEEPAAEAEAASQPASGTQPAATVTPVEDDDLVDEEIIEVFVEEAAEVQETIQQYLSRFLSNFDDSEARTEIRRAFHTLKGSGRMVGATDTGELAWSIENLLNRILDNTLPMTNAIGNLIRHVVKLLPDLVKDFELRRPPSHNIEAIQAHAHDIATGALSPDTEFEPVSVSAPQVEAEPEETTLPPLAEVETVEGQADLPEAAPSEEASAEEQLDIDPTLKNIFMSETETHLESLEAFVADARTRSKSPFISDEVSRALHTLKGSANTAGIVPIARIVIPTEKFFKEARAVNLVVDSDLADLLEATCRFVREGLEQIDSHPLRPLPGTDEYLGQLSEVASQHFEAIEDHSDLEAANKPDPQLLNIFLTEGIDILLDADRILDEWSHDGLSAPEQHQLVTELQTLEQGAQLAGLPDVQSLSGALQSGYREIETRQLVPDADFFEVARAAHEALINMMDQVAAGLGTESASQLVEELGERVQALSPAGAENESSTVEDGVSDSAPEMADSGAFDDMDEDLASIFLEEAEDLIESSAETLKHWMDERQSLTLAQSLQRDLHTLNGGARLSGQQAIASLAHELERLFERLAEDRMSADDDTANLASIGHDTLTRLVNELKTEGQSQGAPDIIESLRGHIDSDSRDTRAETPVKSDSDAAPEAVAEPPERHTEPTEAPMGALSDFDEETLSLFLEEAEEISERLSETMHQWREDLQDTNLLSEILRDLHTLKGGARLAQVKAAGDLAHEMETLLEQFSEGRKEPTEAWVDLLIEGHDCMAVMIETLNSHQAPEYPAALIQRLKQGDLSGAATEAPAASGEAVPAAAVEADEVFEMEGLDPELVELFLTEAEELTHETASQLHNWQENPQDADAMKALLRALHTLKGGARLAEIKPIGDLAHALETLLEGLVEGAIQPTPEAVDLTNVANDALVDMIDAASGGNPVRSANQLVARIENLSGAGPHEDFAPAPPAAVVATPAASDFSEFVSKARASLGRMLEMFDQWQLGTKGSLAALQSGAESLTQLAHAEGIEAIEHLNRALDERLDLPPDTPAEGDLPALVERCLRYCGRLVDQVEEEDLPAIPNELIQELRAGSEADEAASALDLSGIDEDILEVFIEEADELLAGLNRDLGDWQRDPEHMQHPDNMQRQLHTLKGGARLATLNDIGDLAQEFEAAAKDALDHKKPLDDASQREFSDLLSRIRAQVNEVKDAYKAQQLRVLAKANQDEAASAVTEKVVQMQRAAATGTGEGKPRKETKEAAPKAPAAARQTSQDTVRVASGLLDSLVNLAGETSIARGLLETKISDFSYTLAEMQATIDRLREQLRRMDIETEAQVLFRMEKEVGTAYEDFDPLEMDRYSSIQQLSRALSESASDLTDLRETMLERSRAAETLLLQQARINTELQEGLMQTRMVPFTSIVPRLRRIVRQVSGELGKKVDFDVFNPEGELDRTVLERMVAPLEHMVRNALDHGVESPDKRKASGKSETGKVRLSLSREGGDVVIVLEDDGGGINVDAVKKKAIKQGMLEENSEASDSDILQMIFKAGFSTAEKVTQISGRGVGMDVVASEIKQLGGRVAIDSELGKGTRFTVNLPFTVSVNRALMVSTGEDYYAIPLNTIEGIVRVSTFELEEYYKPDAPDYEYAGQKYRLQYLGSLLHNEHHPKLQGQALPLPVILVRGSDRPLALQVDNLMGSREIVVKGLGKQFAGVRGVSGATILGDGSVVVILDLPAMIRSDMANITIDQQAGGEKKPAQAGPKTVMVVDDSVTVRKVTSRLLERQGMQVLTAKDGVDAIALLQDHKPDVMLLDIEMPRMDGFEVASLVRHDSRLSDIPIIMITSRTGQKHRERAMSIGVNEYMGKPFQENSLLEAIDRLTER